MSKYSQLVIPLGQLKVDFENFRIGTFDNVRDAYAAMIAQQGNKLANLARDIVEHGLSPAEPLIVGPDPDDPTQYVVYEGNRRLTAIKLMHTPALAAGTPIHAEVAKLAKEFTKNPITNIPCLVMPDKDSALHWIERKHTSMDGRGISQWDAPAKARFEAYVKGAHRPSKAVIDYLRTAGKLDARLEAAVARRTTNLDRVFQMPYMRTTLGIEIGQDGSVGFSNGNKQQGDELLLDIVKALAHKDLKVDKIKTADQRKEFIDLFLDRSLAAPPKPARASTAKSRTAKKSSPKPSSAEERVWLAPADRGTELPIRDPRLAQVYKEARTLNADRFPATSAVMLRVFLELSTDHFLLSMKVPVPAKYQGKKWTASQIPLKDKIRTVLGVLDPTGSLPNLKQARAGLSDPDRLHAVEELHAAVHGLSANVVGKEARIAWDRWHNYLAMLHNRLLEESL